MRKRYYKVKTAVGLVGMLLVFSGTAFADEEREIQLGEPVVREDVGDAFLNEDVDLRHSDIEEYAEQSSIVEYDATDSSKMDKYGWIDSEEDKDKIKQYVGIHQPEIELYPIGHEYVGDLYDLFYLSEGYFTLPEKITFDISDEDKKAFDELPTVQGKELHFKLKQTDESREIDIPVTFTDTTYRYQSDLALKLIVHAVKKPDKHSQSAIRSYIDSHSFTYGASDSYEITPNPTGGVAGKLSASTLQGALNALNCVRYTAGIPEVSLNETYTDLCQHAADLNYLNQEMSHSPARPAGVSDDFYEKGYKGASESNIAYGFSKMGSRIIWTQPVINAVLDGWIADTDSSNVAYLGHRRWCLDPIMKETGFGSDQGYSAMYSFDSYSREDEDNPYQYILWPAKVTPISLFKQPSAWSICLNDDVYDIWNSTNVTVTMKTKGKTITLDESDTRYPGEFFKLSGKSYGQMACISFYPNLTFSAGDTAEVSVTGLKDVEGYDAPINYTVRFVEMEDIPFKDVKSRDWFYPYVKYAYDNELMSGIGATTFAPMKTVSRAMVVQVLYAASGKNPIDTDSSVFTDLTENWYREAVLWADANGIAHGKGNGIFDPNGNVTRQELAVMLYQFAKFENKDTEESADLSSFTDADSVADWAEPALKWANAEGLMKGRGSKNGNLIAPKDPATRAEYATMMKAIFENVLEK